MTKETPPFIQPEDKSKKKKADAPEKAPKIVAQTAELDETAVTRELQQYKAAGGGAVVDCQPGGCGRNGRILPQLTQARATRAAIPRAINASSTPVSAGWRPVAFGEEERSGPSTGGGL